MAPSSGKRRRASSQSPSSSARLATTWLCGEAQAVGGLILQRLDLSLDTDLPVDRSCPVQDYRGPGHRSDLVALTAQAVRVKGETPVIEATQEDDPHRGHTGSRSGGQRHRVDCRIFAAPRQLEPRPEGGEGIAPKVRRAERRRVAGKTGQELGHWIEKCSARMAPHWTRLAASCRQVSISTDPVRRRGGGPNQDHQKIKQPSRERP